MKIFVLMAALSGLGGGAYAGEALKTLAAQAPEAALSLSVPAPEKAAAGAAEADKRDYAALSGLFEAGQYIQLYELAQPEYPDGYSVDLITSDGSGVLKRGGGLVRITGYYDLARPATKFAAACTLAGRKYKGSDYDDSIASMKLRQVNSDKTITVEVKKNGDQLILKAAGLPEGTGYALVRLE